MSFSWPFALLSLLCAPLVLGIYLKALRRRRRQAVTYSSLGLLRRAIPRSSRWVRHVPVAMLLATLVVLSFASARPQIVANVPVGKTSIILALDDSGSMCSTDVFPNRLSVAQKAARQFVDTEPGGVQIGLVVFSAYAELVVAPTTDRGALDHTIENLSTAPGTAIGAAILQALDAISAIDPQVHPVGNAVALNAAADAGGVSFGPNGVVSTTTTTTLPLQKPGKDGYVPDVVVLLTDGANNRGIAPLDAVPYAVARRVRVYTVGFGTTHPSSLVCTTQQRGGVSGNGFGFGFGGGGGGGFGGGGGGGFVGPGGRSPLVPDIPTLQKVAQRTGGASYTAKTASELAKVFASLPKKVATQKEHHEITSILAALAGLLALLALAASIRWSPYP